MLESLSISLVFVSVSVSVCLSLSDLPSSIRTCRCVWAGGGGGREFLYHAMQHGWPMFDNLFDSWGVEGLSNRLIDNVDRATERQRAKLIEIKADKVQYVCPVCLSCLVCPTDCFSKLIPTHCPQQITKAFGDFCVSQKIKFSSLARSSPIYCLFVENLKSLRKSSLSVCLSACLSVCPSLLLCLSSMCHFGIVVLLNVSGVSQQILSNNVKVTTAWQTNSAE